ncbi:MAG TPA: hypothetical protein VEV87_06665 [Chitinophagaceae bacterium]|nr:hypothetical protein [Chitinophagaceae bacterium]
MIKQAWILVILFFIGLIILVLPDNGRPVIRFNELHGPSLIDLTGILLVLVSWVAATIIIINRWQAIIIRIGKRNLYFLTLLYFLFLLGIMLGLILSLDLMLWFFAGAAFLVNILFVIFAFQVKNRSINANISQ